MANTVLGEKREGDVRIRSKGGIAVIEETYSFIVESDSKDNSRFTISQTTGLPVVGVTTSSYGLTICSSKDARRRATNPLIWDVICEFSSDVDERQSNNSPTDPEVWIPIYETKFERLAELVTRDVNGDSISNSAGQTFPNGLTIGRFIPVWEFFQFEPASVSDKTIIDRCETVNSAPFKGCAAKTCLLTVLSSVIGYYYGARRRLTQYSIKYNDRDWQHRRMDVGDYYVLGARRLAFLTDETDENQKIVVNGPLDGAGGQRAIGQDPVILTFDVYRSISFSFLRG